MIHLRSMARSVPLALILTCWASISRADFKADSLALFGSWRWVSSYGGLLAANETPPASGWSRVLYLRRDGTYAYWEQDSAANYLLCSGPFTIHPATRSRIEDGPPASLWIDLHDWWEKFDEHQLVAFADSNTIITYPGSEEGRYIISVSDALKSRYNRESTRPIPTGRELRGVARIDSVRPPRLLPGRPHSYYVDLSFGWRELLRSSGSPYEWQDWQFPKSVLDSYEYTSHQIPSAVVGDFDGDSTADVAVYGETAQERQGGAVVAVLSNHGHPRSVTILDEPVIQGRVGSPDAAPRDGGKRLPDLYLTLWPGGRPLKNAAGNTRILSTAAVACTRFDGSTVIYYLEGDRFREGSPGPVAH